MSNKNKEEKASKKTLFKPSEMMRSMRPEIFSDTLMETVPVLDKNMLEYHLESLTSRKQEYAFEEFCRRLSELEICPNLKPQTGPTGGGDSKTDASTYPVANALRVRCYFGSPHTPSDEEWAFAFSCKKKWRDKVNEDVEKIAKLNRKYTKVYFISNQFIKDKERAKAEDSLINKYNLDIHILDRSWIVSRVIEHKREKIAIEILGIRSAEIKKPQPGPKDFSRQQDLDVLLKRLNQPEIYFGNDYALAQDYLEAAKLARSLEKPRHEIDGFFSRALDLAIICKVRGLIIRCGYDYAWTTLWWYYDSVKLETIYTKIENYFPGTDDADDCQLFLNLWNLLYGSVKSGAISAKEAKLDERHFIIKTEINRLASEKERPNSALHAETLSYLLSFHEWLEDPSKAEKNFEGLRNCLKKSKGFFTYAAMQFIDNLKDMGEFIGDLPGYDKLFSEICNITKNRYGETSEGKLLYERGLQLLCNAKPKEALYYLGKAQPKLAKEETMRESIRSALGRSDAYMRMELYWAARMEALHAAHTALNKVDSNIRFPFEGYLAAKRMAWLELRFERIAPFIAWYELSCMIAKLLDPLKFNIDKIIEDLQFQEMVFGCLLLNLNSDDVKKVEGLKHALDHPNFPIARYALIYALDNLELIDDEVIKKFDIKKSEVTAFFTKWKNQPAS